MNIWAYRTSMNRFYGLHLFRKIFELEQDKLRNAVLLIQQETIRTNFVSSLIVLH